MRHPILVTLCLGGALAVSGCDQTASDAEVERAIDEMSVNAIDESNLSDVMLTVGDPDEAVTYFERASAEKPDRMDLRRGLAQSLVRARRVDEGVKVWKEIVASNEVTDEDRIGLADALIRAGNWTQAGRELDKIPPTFETYKRYRLEAMVADSNEEWKKADTFYETAVGLSTKPSGALNNWGYSKLTRGDFAGAETLFARALTYDRTLFTAKNNLVLSRAAQRKYDMPVVPMTQVERAQLLHTMALSAIKQGDVTMGKTLLKQAIDTHPQHFEAAVTALAALEDNVTNS
jgi:Flp pilus assembly protein TadD